MVQSVSPYAACLAVLLMVLLILFATPFGLGVSPDSTQYLATARNLVAGKGLMTIWWSGRPEPLSHFPPVYPLVLAAAGASGVDPAVAARWIHVILLPLNALLVGWLAATIAGGPSERRARTGAIAVFAVAVSPAMATAHAMVWSEPLFITLLLTSLMLLAKSMDSYSCDAQRAGNGFLLCAGALTGVATVTRYAGIVLVGTGVVVLVVFNHDGLGARMRRAALFVAVAMTPILLWVLYNHARGANGTNRALAVHVISLADLIFGIKTAASFVVPFVPWWPVRVAALAVIGISAAAIVFALARIGLRAVAGELSTTPPSPADQRPMISAMLVAEHVVFLVAYPLFLLVSISLLDRSTQLDSRILLPMLPVTIALVAGIAGRWGRRGALPGAGVGRLLRPAAVTLAVAYFSIQLCGTLVWATSARRAGLGLEALGREHPVLFRRVRELPREIPVYSNMPDAIYEVTGRVVRGLPYKYSPTSLTPNRRFAQELRAIADSATRPEYVVVLDARTDTPFIPDERDVKAWLPIDHVDTLAGGRIFELRREARESDLSRSSATVSSNPSSSTRSSD